MNDPIKLTVGIPAYNEQDNIGNIITSVLSQKQDGFELAELVIVSDASTDNTVQMIQSFNDPRIILIENDERIGAARSQNKIISCYKGDVLMLLNADILIRDASFMSKMLAPFKRNPKLGIVAARVEPLPAMNFFERVINTSAALKTELYEQINNEDNVYLCHGRARAFSRQLTNTLVFPPVTGEDAFSYIHCIESGFEFLYLANATVYYRSPQSLRDHLKQSRRFFKSMSTLEKEYNYENKSYYRIPFSLALKTFLRFFGMHPLLITAYSAVYLIARVSSVWYHTSVVWDVSLSSKTTIK